MVTFPSPFLLSPRPAERYDFMHEVPRLSALAIGASTLADSYRGVGVGAAIAVEDEQTGLIGIFTGANSKPVASSLKRCAEMRTLSDARQAGFSVVRGIVVAGPSDPEIVGGITNELTPTLHPCELCLTRMDWYEYEGQLRVPGATPVITVGKEDGRFQIHTVEEMQTLHGLRKSQEMQAGDAFDPALYGTSFAQWEQGLEAAAALPEAERVNQAAAMRTSLMAAAAMQALVAA